MPRSASAQGFMGSSTCASRRHRFPTRYTVARLLNQLMISRPRVGPDTPTIKSWRNKPAVAVNTNPHGHPQFIFWRLGSINTCAARADLPPLTSQREEIYGWVERLLCQQESFATVALN
jgi:hypothetical protein